MCGQILGPNIVGKVRWLSVPMLMVSRRRCAAVAGFTFYQKCSKNRRHPNTMPPGKVEFSVTPYSGIIRIRFKGRRSTFLSACHTSSPYYVVMGGLYTSARLRTSTF